MTSVEYDLDTSSGLMSKIQALIAPPENDDTSKSKKKEGLDLHPYYKRPGKGHNRDCCDACGEGGNLICCDKCPASFHLSCHDPPLEDEDIPLGQWLCHKCRVAIGLPPLKPVRKENSENGEKVETTSDTVSVVSKDDTPAETPLRGRSRTSSTASVESNKSRRGRSSALLTAPPTAPPTVLPTALPLAPTNPVTTVSVASGPDKASALDILISAASSMNPKQFELPREMVLPINFPGTDRAPLRGRKAAAAKRSRTHDLENGMVPLPAKLCYECRKSCRKAPLLACDYCPLLFHLDCLDPPLTSLPSGRWMCPNHVEQAIDERLLTSLSVTQRVALYDKYTAPIDQDSVKSEFLKKTRRKNPPFRFKVKLTPRNRAQVPNAVRELYKNRPPLIPTLKDVLRENEFVNRLEVHSGVARLETERNLSAGPTEKEQEEWLKGLIGLQTSIACHLNSRKRNKPESADKAINDFCELEIKQEFLPQDEIVGSETTENLESESFLTAKKAVLSNGLSNEQNSSSKEETTLAMSVKRKSSPLFSKNKRFNSENFQNGEMELDELESGPSCPNSHTVDEKRISPVSQLQNFDESIFSNSSSDKIPSKQLDSVLQNSIDCSVPDVVDLEHLDVRLIRLLASQRLQQLRKSVRDNETPLKHSEEQSELSVMWPSIESGVRPRALLTPLNSSQPPMPIYYRVMEIGTGGDMDVCLSYYGHCNFVTAKHAVIICDEVNRHYELMNYSEHGTTVDNVLYSCDFSDKPPIKEREQPVTAQTQHHGRRSGGGSTASADASEAEVEVPPLIQKIRAIVDKRRGVTREENYIPDMKTLPSSIGKVDMKCNCRSSSSSMIGGSGAGWEGTALLNHGSFIKFGCIQFTFSILNYATTFQKQPSSEPMEVVDSEINLSLPHRILKRERDSTSSSTLTVSPSPPPDKVAPSVGHSHSTRFSKRNQKGLDHLSADGIEERGEKTVEDDSDDETLEEEKDNDDEMEDFEEEEEEEEEEVREGDVKKDVLDSEIEDSSLPISICVPSTSGIKSSEVASSSNDAF